MRFSKTDLDNSGVPDSVNVDLWVKNRKKIISSLMLESFPRLSGLVSFISEGFVQLTAERDNYCIGSVKGFISGKFTTTCARCLEPKVFEIKENIFWKLVDKESISSRNFINCEIIEIHERRLLLREAIEDQLILAIPIFISHADCKVSNHVFDDGISEFDTSPESNKFSELLKLRHLNT